MNNIKIAGAGTINGGIYNVISSAGSCKINGDIIANEIKITGSGKAQGNIQCKDLSVAGSFSVDGNAKCVDTQISGSCKIQGKMEANTAEIKGQIKVLEELNVDRLYVKSSGSQFNNIYGDEITIKMEKLSFMLNRNTINEIEATTVDIENVKVKRISAHDVTIGKRCMVELVEYTGSLTVHPNAKIIESIKIV